MRSLCPKWRHAERGQTIAELMVVVAIIAVVASVALPGAGFGRSDSVDQVARDVAQAMRFARATAMRTGVAHGVFVDTPNQSLSVVQLDAGASVDWLSVPDPLTREPYTLRIDANALHGAAFAYEGFKTPAHVISFGGSGEAALPGVAGSTEHPLNQGHVELHVEGVTRFVRIEPMTGKVFIQ